MSAHFARFTNRVRRAVCTGVAVLACSAMAAGGAAAAEVEILPDFVYGHKDGLAMTLDVLKPKSGANGAAILYMVSGGWVSRWAPPPESVKRFQFLLDKGFTVVIVRHGSSPRYHVPDAVSDVRRAVRYVRYHARQWGVDPNRLGVHGGSAGGHLSLVLGMASDEGDAAADEPFMRVSNRVAAVVAYYPPVDLRTMARGAVPAAEGQRFPALNFAREMAPDISPILFVTPDDPPTLLIHGDADATVNISHSEKMYAAMQEQKVKSKFITLPGAGHGFRDADAETAQNALVAWFEETLAAAGSAAAQPVPAPAGEPAIEAEVNAFMERYWQLFSTGQIEQLVERVYHPSGQLGNGGITPVEELARRFPDTRKTLLAGGYGHSNMPVRNICVLTPTLAIVSGRGVRYLKDGGVMGEYGWTYTLSKGTDGWRMVSILSHDPGTFVTCSK